MYKGRMMSIKRGEMVGRWLGVICYVTTCDVRTGKRAQRRGV